jgi:hypothetical protein
MRTDLMFAKEETEEAVEVESSRQRGWVS